MTDNRKSLFVFLGCLVAVVILRNAWICDDAYITIRTIDNWMHGYGLVWNVSERVQAYTHPLWLFALSPLYAATGESYFTVLFLSIVLSMLAYFAVLRLSTTTGTACLVSSMLIFSKSFMDFTTSGLETPLIAFLLAMLFRSVWLNHQKQPRDIFVPTILFSLLLLTRLDLGCMILPPYLYHVFKTCRSSMDRLKGIAGYCLAGLTPIISWLMFSTVYYGFPFPNTAYAKLATGVTFAEAARQGIAFYLAALDTDPVTVLGILFGAAISLNTRGSVRWFATGALIYSGYVFSIGGDFMGTRFLFPPLVACVLLLSVQTFRLPVLIPAIVSLLVLGATNQYSPLTSNADYQGYGIKESGVADERGYYFRHLGLLHFTRNHDMPFSSPRFQEGINLCRDSSKTNRTVVVGKSVGLSGYAAGPDVHIVDPFGLCDPFLARLDAVPNCRIGHFRRDVPIGYIKTLESGQNQMASSGLKEFYQRLSLVISGPIFRAERFREICRFNLHLNDRLAKTLFFTSDSFSKHTGTNIPAEGAFSDTVLSARPGDDRGYLAFGNYRDLRPGRYVATFRISGSTSQTGDVCRLEVAANEGRSMLASRVLGRSDFVLNNGWFYVDLPFSSTIDHGRSIETRMYHTGTGEISLDTVEIVLGGKGSSKDKRGHRDCE